MYVSLSRLIQSDLLLVFPLLTQKNAMKHPYHYSIYSSILFRIVQSKIKKKIKYDVLLLLILSFFCHRLSLPNFIKLYLNTVSQEHNVTCCNMSVKRMVSMSS